MALDRSAMKSSLARKQETSEATKDDRGKFRGIFKDNVPNLQLWKVAEGDHEFDIIPYPAGDKDPDKKVAVGDFTYTFIVWVHRGIGVNEDSFICLARTYGDKCPVCEYQARLKDTNASDEEIKRWNPTRRTLYNVLVYDNEKETAKGVQVLDIAHYYMEPELLALARPRSRGGVETGEKIFFASPDKDGKSIAFTREGTRRNTDYKGYKFIDRDYDLEDEIINSAHILDQIVHIPSYDEVKDALDTGLPDDDKANGSHKEDDIPSEGRRGRGRSAATQEKKEDSPKEEVKEEVKETKKEEVKETEPPKEEVKETKKEEGTKTAELVCPEKEGTFGVDIEKLGACQPCEIWEQCNEANTRIMAEKRAARAASGGRLKK